MDSNHPDFYCVWDAKNVVTAGSQGALDLTRYCGKQVWWIGSKCALTAMSALSPGSREFESGLECAQPRKTTFEDCMADSMGNSTINPVIRYTIDPVSVVYVYVCMCICINNMYYCYSTTLYVHVIFSK